MQLAVARELNLPGPPEPHDVADALSIALCHYFASATILRGTSGAIFRGVNQEILLGPDPDSLEEGDTLANETEV